MAKTKKQKLTQEQVDALTGYATIIQQAREQAGAYLGKIAVSSWGYAEGKILGFNYNLQEKTVEIEEQQEEESIVKEK